MKNNSHNTSITSPAMRLRKHGWSLFWGLTFVLLMGLWVRSYALVESIRLWPAPGGGAFQCVSVPGNAVLGTFKAARPWTFFRVTAAEYEKDMAQAPAAFT